MRRVSPVLVFVMLILLSGYVYANALESFFNRTGLQENSAEQILNACRIEPRVMVDIVIPGPRKVRDKPHGYEGFHTDSHGQQGLAFISGGFDVSFALEHIRAGQNPGCVRIRSLKVTAGYEPPQIWLDPKIRKGSCEYGVVLNHELQHVQHFQDHLKKFRTSVLHELPVLVRRQGYSIVDMGGVEAAEDRLKVSTMNIINSLHDRSWAVSEKLDAALDSPAEYWRLSNLCR